MSLSAEVHHKAFASLKHTSAHPLLFGGLCSLSLLFSVLFKSLFARHGVLGLVVGKELMLVLLVRVLVEPEDVNAKLLIDVAADGEHDINQHQDEAHEASSVVLA